MNRSSAAASTGRAALSVPGFWKNGLWDHEGISFSCPKSLSLQEFLMAAAGSG